MSLSLPYGHNIHPCHIRDIGGHLRYRPGCNLRVDAPCDTLGACCHAVCDVVANYFGNQVGAETESCHVVVEFAAL